MINNEFRELIGQYSQNPSNNSLIFERIKENLIKRNGGSSLYSFQYTQKNKICDIEKCIDIIELQEINGDMQPLGI